MWKLDKDRFLLQTFQSDYLQLREVSRFSEHGMNNQFDRAKKEKTERS